MRKPVYDEEYENFISKHLKKYNLTEHSVIRINRSSYQIFKKYFEELKKVIK